LGKFDERKMNDPALVTQQNIFYFMEPNRNEGYLSKKIFECFFGVPMYGINS